MKKTVGAILKSEGPFEVNHSGVVFRFEEKPKDARCKKFECFVPLEIKKKDDFGVIRVLCDNFPDHLLNHKGNGKDLSFPHLSLVRVIEEEEIKEQPIIEEKHSDAEFLQREPKKSDKE